MTAAKLTISDKLALRVLCMLAEVAPAADRDRSSAATAGIRLALGVHGERVVTVAATDGKILMEREDTVPADEWSMTICAATEDLILPAHLPWKAMLRSSTCKGYYGVHLHVGAETVRKKAVLVGQWTFPDGAASERFTLLNGGDTGIKFPAYRMAFDSQSLGTPTTPNPLGINAGLLARLTDAWPSGTLAMTYGRGLVFKPVQQGDDEERNFHGITRRALIMPTDITPN